jgi:hypothetical protein
MSKALDHGALDLKTKPSEKSTGGFLRIPAHPDRDREIRLNIELV